MQLIEGQAYFPETRETIQITGKANYISTIFENEPPMMANGTQADEGELAGNEVGSSQYARDHAQKLWEAIMEDGDNISRKFHGGGSRYIEEADGSNSLIAKCVDKLPTWAPKPYVIKVQYHLTHILHRLVCTQ